jgi:hypothetical protein
MYAMATRWTFKAGSSADALGAMSDEVCPVLEAQQGYVYTVVVQTGADSFLSLVCWSTEEDAKRAMSRLALLTIRHLGPHVREVERIPGPVVYERLGRGSCI